MVLDGRATDPDVHDLARRVLGGDRTALARAITFIESNRPDHRKLSTELLDELLAHAGGSIRIGITGPPGVGKSTLIEALGLHVTREGRRLAVLAVDPSSTRSGGSVLGDKTRMAQLARDPLAFIRPSPAGRTLGGVARRTRDAVLLCEAAGAEVVVIETVGVGQSDTVVTEMVDTSVLLVQPGAGDSLQGIKRGSIELADIIAVAKADGPLAQAASRAVADYREALRLLRPRHPDWETPVVATSGVTGAGIPELWELVEEHQQTMLATGAGSELRGRQARAAFWREVTEALLDRLRDDPAIRKLGEELERNVEAGVLTARRATQRLLDADERRTAAVQERPHDSS